jgi:hypothetical protein
MATEKEAVPFNVLNSKQQTVKSERKEGRKEGRTGLNSKQQTVSSQRGRKEGRKEGRTGTTERQTVECRMFSSSKNGPFGRWGPNRGFARTEVKL